MGRVSGLDNGNVKFQSFIKTLRIPSSVTYDTKVWGKNISKAGNAIHINEHFCATKVAYAAIDHGEGILIVSSPRG